MLNWTEHATQQRTGSILHTICFQDSCKFIDEPEASPASLTPTYKQIADDLAQGTFISCKIKLNNEADARKSTALLQNQLQQQLDDRTAAWQRADAEVSTAQKVTQALHDQIAELHGLISTGDQATQPSRMQKLCQYVAAISTSATMSTRLYRCRVLSSDPGLACVQMVGAETRCLSSSAESSPSSQARGHQTCC